MPVPTAYSEAELAAFMHTQIEGFPTKFSWEAPSTDAGVYAETVTDVLLEYGVSDIANAKDIKKLRALAKVAVWKKVLRQLATWHKFSADGSSFDQQQMFEMARQSLATAEAEAAVYTSDYQISVGSVTWANDPYRYPLNEDEE